MVNSLGCHCIGLNAPTQLVETSRRRWAEKSCNVELLQETAMATSKSTSRGRAQDRARVAGGQKHEIRYEAEKTGKPKAAVKSAVSKVGNSRKKVERELKK
jgi:hypothetical protein